MSFDDPNVPYARSPGGTPQQDKVENVRLVSPHSNDRAPLQKNRQQVMLELIDASSTGDRFGLDLVAVLDVSGSMEGKRLDRTKAAMQFVIKKLSPIDRLSIVKFSDNAEKLRQLSSVTKECQAELKDLVDGLSASGYTNISHGLETAHKVLADRRHIGGRVASIFLLSDGDQNRGGDATDVDVRDVAVYTFGFGTKYDPKVLDEIARKSQGGTFSYVEDGENMSEPFSQILGGLLSVVVQDLKLTMWPQPGESTIEKVDPGLYVQTKEAGSVTVSFGDLFAREVRKVIVDILLHTVRWRKKVIAINAQCSYSIQGKPFLSGKFTLRIIRTGSAVDPNAMKPEVRTELARRRHAIMLEEAITMADQKDLNSARNKLVEDQNALYLEQSNSMIDILRTELEKLLKLINSPGLRAHLRSLKTSHDRQRVAATGDVKGDRLFKTPLTDMFVVQAQEFEEQPTMEVRPVDDDFKVENRVRGQRVEATTWWGEIHDRHRSSRWAWAMVILCTLLAIGVIVIGAALFAVFLLYKPKMPYLVVSDAQLGVLQYARDGTIQYLQVSITILAKNNNSKADAAFSRVNLALEFHGADVAVLKAAPFLVAPESSLPLQYNVVSAGRTLDPAGKRSMEESLNAGVVPLDLHGKARTRWKVGIFLKVQFWTRISCRLRFFFPGNGTVMPTDRDRCRSRSP